MVTLRQLRYLAALAEHRHFGRAADACAVTQPALSMQIRELERLLGVELVERRPGEVVLTELGLEVAQRGDRVLAGARDLVDFARHRGRVLSGRLHLGLIPTLAPYVLPKILPGLQRRYPDLRVELRETQTKTLVEELVRGSLDVIMLALPVHEADIETSRLFDDPFLLGVPAEDPRPDTARVSAADIDQQQLILLEEGHCLRDQALAYCAGARRDAAMSLGATSLATVMQMVANGYGVTLVPRVAVDVEVRDERVKLLRFVEPGPGRTIGLAWRRSSPRKVDFVALGQLVMETLGTKEPRVADARLAEPRVAPRRGPASRQKARAVRRA
jgi:LysR family transcriptional regulator, hydrogen peroxide-inducible genes activator